MAGAESNGRGSALGCRKKMANRMGSEVVTRKVRRRVCSFFLACFLAWTLAVASYAVEPAGPVRLSVSVAADHCSYVIGVEGQPVLRSGIAAEVDGQWLDSEDYPLCKVSESDITGDLGPAHQWRVEYLATSGKPVLGYLLRAFLDRPYAEVQATVTNNTQRPIKIEALRSIEAAGGVNLRGPPAQDRVLSGSFSEDWPPIRIRDLSDAPAMLHRGVGSQLIYNRSSQQALLVGALTAEKLLTILRLRVGGSAANPSIQSYDVESTGTTELTSLYSLRGTPPENRVELSIPLNPGASLSAERLLVGVDTDPHRLLDTYGELIRTLHHPRPATPTPMGWWSWTAYYNGLNQDAALENAQWLAHNLKALGYTFFHIDDGYEYDRGDYTAPNASLFPGGLAPLEKKIAHLGLTPGLWTAPFEVGARSWVFLNHPGWLVRNAQGEPLFLAGAPGTEKIYVLDVTNPGAQQYLRQTYSVLTRDWGVRYLKLDFMDATAVEGDYFAPHTTALQAERIGLQLIRNAVGNSVLIDKDGSPMLTPVGLVDEGRISQDTGHMFEASREAATGIAARYYMNHNFFTSDPDAFTVSTETVPGHWHGGTRPLTLDEAKVSIALAAVSGGMFEIGDALPVLASEPDRLALVENRTLIDMARLGRASTPLDLMDYLPQDQQPSIFYLDENPRERILTVFDWTDQPRKHTFRLDEFGLRASAATATDVFTAQRAPLAADGVLEVEQPAHSVRMFRLLQDGAAGGPAPAIAGHAPTQR
jgi:alpha-galactosidase